MIDHLNRPATAVFVAFFVFVSLLGFVAARWKRGDLNDLHEWGLGGRRFGSVISWFLIGGDLYTAYTVIAVPSVVYAIGAYGFFAIPYTILIYPLLYVVFPKLWAVTHRHGYLTAGDYVYGRYGNRWLEGAVAFTGILATMPYIALQLIGMERVIKALGFAAEGWMAHLPLGVAFILLALYTYKSGLRAPAMIAFVKDIMIYIVVIAAIVIIPAELGGYGAIFDAAGAVLDQKSIASGGKIVAGLTLAPVQIAPFITLAIGSAMALFMYPHAVTGILSASGGRAIRANAITLPAYSIALILIALMGYMAHAAGIKTDDPQDAVPQLFLKMFPDWFAGFAFASIAIGALVPAAIMSIGAANTFARNLWKPLVNPTIDPRNEAALAKFMSLLVKVGALLVILFMPTRFALDLQLLGGIWMIQVFPAIVCGLFSRRFSGTGLLAGWVIGMGLGTYLAWGPIAWTPLHRLFGLDMLGLYNGLIALAANLGVAFVVSVLLPQDEQEGVLISNG
ncbi:monocarboxylate uptake permease MctP [Beijerinckia indica]|uniref:Na+/solute symporter n=1 Tax=Beijerinckia indica subsp. indica (strain ATCC 9039 / DSM 1715 / NCIMB 8712) TaxID=395963 RepID=B2IHT2_BEII9|nr:sodium:solute symporter family protein [Beijerinckia indica]ACB95975.1 Na+/solute symporter [Beijerinckia indica subsp. indica ATCC 9039]